MVNVTYKRSSVRKGKLWMCISPNNDDVNNSFD